MSICHYTVTISQPHGNEADEQWHSTPVPLEELPAGLIEDQV